MGKALVEFIVEEVYLDSITDNHSDYHNDEYV